MGILDRFRKKADPPAVVNRSLAIILLRSTAPIAFDKTLQHLQASWPDGPSIIDIDVANDHASAQIPGGALGITHLAFPFPAAHLEGPATLASHWPSARDEIALHQSHVLVHASSNTLDITAVRLLHTKLVAAVLATADTIGVYVGEAMLVRSSADYEIRATSASREDLPILLWVGFNGVIDEPTISAYTTGLTSFGVLELEIRGSTASLAAVLGQLADVAHYQISSGRALLDGDTFGQTIFDRKRVRYDESQFIPEMTVAVLETP